jgi:hypothetical protein
MAGMNELQKANLFKRFDQGRIVAIHSISDFDVVEFDLLDRNSGELKGEILFSPYYNSEPLGQWCKTLDEALCYALAGKYLNAQAGQYIVNLLALKSDRFAQ